MAYGAQRVSAQLVPSKATRAVPARTVRAKKVKSMVMEKRTCDARQSRETEKEGRLLVRVGRMRVLNSDTTAKRKEAKAPVRAAASRRACFEEGIG